MRRNRRQKDGKKRERLQIKKLESVYRRVTAQQVKVYIFSQFEFLYTRCNYHKSTRLYDDEMKQLLGVARHCTNSKWMKEKKEQKAVDSQHKTSLSAMNTEIKLHKTLLLQCLLHSALICLREVITSRYQILND